MLAGMHRQSVPPVAGQTAGDAQVRRGRLTRRRRLGAAVSSRPGTRSQTSRSGTRSHRGRASPPTRLSIAVLVCSSTAASRHLGSLHTGARPKPGQISPENPDCRHTSVRLPAAHLFGCPTPIDRCPAGPTAALNRKTRRE
ncbi:hypothetical protein LSAT2_028466 [Lamellibrachia satsuma]|nr:hypothetical protein LSAT2_028466 [Lamellibrachia satsuma]